MDAVNVTALRAELIWLREEHPHLRHVLAMGQAVLAILETGEASDGEFSGLCGTGSDADGTVLDEEQ